MSELIMANLNRKGGCFKTSGVFHLSGYFAGKNKRTLLIDADPQSSLSHSMLGGPTAVETLPIEKTIAAVFDDTFTGDPASLVHPTPHEGIFIVPASEHLAHFALPDPEQHELLGDAIKQFLLEVGQHFDVVLIDTPPNLQLPSWAACVAATHVLTPVIPEEYASQGLVHIRRFINLVRERRNPTLKWVGILLTMVQSRIAVHAAFEKGLRQTYGELVLKTKVPYAAIFKESVTECTPLPLYKPAKRTAGVQAITQLGDEIAKRIKNETMKEAA